MISQATDEFWELYWDLPESIRRQAKEAYRLFVINPHYPSLRFRRVHPVEPFWSARINDHYRALGRRDGNVIIWFWIGPHGGYDQQLNRR